MDNSSSFETAGNATQMKVCFVCPNILPLFGIPADGNFGGAEVQIRQTAGYLAKQGSEVDILVSTELGAEPRMIERFRLIPAIEDTTRKRSLHNVKAKLTLLKALRRSAADVYVSTCAAPDAGLISMYARLSRKPFIYRVSSDLDCDGTFERQNGWRGRLFGLGLRLADAVIAQHDGQAAQLSQRRIAPSVIRNSFDLTAQAESKPRDIDALWVGRSEPLKQPWLFLEIASRLPDRHFTMICAVKRGQEQLSDNLRVSASELPNVTFFEGVPFTDVASYFRRAKIFVGTSESEGFPNTYIESCLAGVPIASLEVDPAGFIERNDCGIVARGDLTALVDGIERLLTDPDEWEGRSRNARAYAMCMHNLDLEGAKWLELLRSLQKPRRLRKPPGTPWPQSQAR